MTDTPATAKAAIQAKVQSQVIRYALELIVEDMAQSLMRTARSVVIKESQDLSCCIFDRRGRVVVQSNHAPMLLAGSAYTIEAAIEQLGARGFKDGDIVMANDPYRGGQHLMDVMMISPVFVDGEHVGYVSCLAHHSDLGGASPGGVAGGLRDIYSEGLCFPFVRAYIEGEENRDLFAMIEANVRAPYKTLSDMRAQVAACLTGIRRYKETIARFGLPAIEAAADMLIRETEERMTVGLDKLPDGEFTGEEWVDDDGVTDQPAHIVVRIKKRGRELEIDLTESSDQVQGNINCPLATVMAAVQYPFTCALDNTVCANHGMFKVLKFKTRKGSILDPVRPAAVAARTNVSLKVQEATIKALAKMLPGKMMATSHGQMTHMAIVGDDPSHHRTFIYNDLAGGGAGARPTKDGRDGQDTHLGRFMNTPTEMIEHEFPVRCHRYELVPDSGGAGLYRGALAVLRDIEILTEKALFSRYGDRQKFRPQGLDGGGDAEPGRFVLNPGRDDKRLKSKGVDEVKQGDVLRIVTPGGAGYGDPRKRDIRAIAADLADGKTSEDFVMRHYGADKLFEAKRLLAGTHRAAAE
jgi:N-methylhydantoinase B